MEFKLTHEQKDFFHEVKNGTGNILVKALAGASKTFCAVEATKLIPEDKSCCFLAFNRHIKEELKDKLPKNIRSYTSHGLGLSALKRKYGNDIQMDEYKIDKIITKKMKKWTLNESIKTKDDVKQYVDTIKKMVNLCRTTLTTEKKYIKILAFRYGLKLDENVDVRRILSILEESTNDRKTYDFMDMVYLPATDNKIWMFQYDFVFVDEVQDISRVQQKLIEKILKRDRITKKTIGRLISIGDEKQCQPKGTIVNLDNHNTIKIEDLKIGDKVKSYHTYKGRFSGSKKINNIKEEDYDGRMIKIHSNNKSSSYTPNHKAIARFNRRNLNKKLGLYLIEKEGCFTVDYSKLRTNINTISYFSGPNPHFLQPKDRSWLLDVFIEEDDVIEAKMDAISNFGLSNIMLSETDCLLMFNNYNTAERYNKILEYLRPKSYHYSEEVRDKINGLLKSYNKDYRYPFYDKNNLMINDKDISQIYAINLFPTHMEVSHYKTTSRYSNWRTINKIENYNYKGKIYSLEVDVHEHYIADGILTHNSIYGFNGITENTFNWFINYPNTKILPLTYTFRCAKNIVKQANKIVPELKALETAEDGVVRDGNVIEECESGDFILCRTTAPLISLFFDIIKTGKKATIKGSDIGLSLLNMLGQHKSIKSVIDFWIKKLINKKLILKKKGMLIPEEDSSYMSLRDNIEVLKVLSENCRTIDHVRKKINEIFTDKISGIVLSTIHKSKGLEANRVFIVRPDLLPLKTVKSNWERKQEKNLEYVAITRAKKELIYDNNWTNEK